MRVVSVVGARPNFVKLAPVAEALAQHQSVEHVIVHTGQHYDAFMSESFFADLALPQPSHNLGVGAGSHALQTAAVLERFEPLCRTLQPDWVLVYGDVNSTLAAALTAAKLDIPVAHVEAGLRSRDRTMPEEHNRVLTDHLSTLLFTPSPDAGDNLRREGIPDEAIAFVGNVMIDSLVNILPRAHALGAERTLGLDKGRYVLVTLHRPSNVDDPSTLRELCAALVELQRERPVVFAVHPRTRARLDECGLRALLGDVRLLEPQPYTTMIGLTASAGLVITDSGGVQEETTYLGIPCLTVRQNTERPITVTHGTNRLVAPERDAILEAARSHAVSPGPRSIERWDGRAAERLVELLLDAGRR